MTVIIDAHQRGRQRARRGRFAAFFLGFLFIFSHISCLSASESSADIGNASRKARFFPTPSSPHHRPHHARRSDAGMAGSASGIFDSAKRIVHTGPNPLHN